MSAIAMDIARMVDMLPESDQQFAREFVKKLVLAWDPDLYKSNAGRGRTDTGGGNKRLYPGR